MPDAATQARQAELEKRHRDLTKPVPPLGSDGDSLRSIRGFEGITDEMLREREAHSRGTMVAKVSQQTVNLSKMTREELLGLADAALSEAARKPETENENA